MTDVLSLRVHHNLLGHLTLGELLSKVLEEVWNEGDLFTASHAIQMSIGWQQSVYAAMIEAGLISGSVTEEGWVTDPDTEAADVMICDAIQRVFGVPRSGGKSTRKTILNWE